MADRLHLVNIHSTGTTAPASDANLMFGEIAVQYNSDAPALYIKKANGEYAKFVPNIDISGATSGSGNVVTGISVSNNTVTAQKGNVLQTATGDTLISATVSGGTKVVVSATTGLTDAVAKKHEHSNKDLLDTYTQTEADLADAVAKKHEHKNKTELDKIATGDKAKWDSAYTDMLTGITKGTDGNFVTTSVSAKSGKSQSVGVAVTTGATSAATDTQHDGLATAYETKQYIDKQISAATESQVTTARTITAGDMLNGGGNLSANITINHDAVSYANPTTSATGTIGSDREFTALTGLAEDGFGHVTSATQTKYTLPAETQLTTGSTGSGNVVTGITVSNHKITKVMGYAVVSASGDDYISAATSNGALSVSLKSVAAAKNDIANASTTGSVADAKAVKDYVDEKVTASVQYKGATGGTPAAATSEVGDLYIASTGWTIQAASSATGSQAKVEKGDYIICRETGKWDVIEKNDTGTVTSSAALTAGALVLGNGNQTIKKATAVGDATHPIYIDASGKPQTANTIHEVSATDGSNALAWNSAVTLATITIDGTSTTIDAKLPANPNTDTATTETGHYTPQTAASTAGTATSFIRQIKLDSNKHVIDVVTGSPAAVVVVNCGATITTGETTLGTIDGTAIKAKIGVTNSGATIPMSASTATTLATVGGVNITAKTSMNKLSIAGAAANAGTAEFDGKSDVTITVLDCGTY